ncbi:YsnF/AvaK domain-containing protein [Chitinasiproducens palmae]|uniref:Conserved domain-containing protein n=1 Tax=Chitinasiproducens palmae TaxID=1770053 RepID=A0A1H2PMR9_9BURK|nr:YsnF/AvaK domain-containing protein [Chitinasiproducens palmae]SDV47972.1 conserved domain-containing protein [Chitinasiproducens palmae]
MAQTIIGVFDSKQRAQDAVNALVSDGFSSAHIDVHAYDDYAAGTYTDAGTFGTPATGTGAASLGADPLDTGYGTQRAATTGSLDADALPRTATTGTTYTGTERPHEGILSRIEHFFGNLFGNDDRPDEIGHYSEAVRRGGTLVTVDVDDEARVERARDILWQNGAADIDSRVAQWRETGYDRYDSAAPLYSRDEADAERQRFAVVQEELEVGKREVNNGGVRVYSRVTERPVSETVNLREEHATIERRAVDRPATAADLREGWTEVNNTEERAVVNKSARVVEEVVVGKEASTRTETISDTVRGTDVQVEQVPGDTTINTRSTLDRTADVPLDSDTTTDPAYRKPL